MQRWAIAVIAIALAACSSGEDTTRVEPEILGVWEMVTFTVEGFETRVDEGINTASVPYLEFELDGISGDAGCNSMGSGEEQYRFEDGVLQASEVIMTAAMCSPESLMAAETALREMMWSDVPINVSFDGSLMRWDHGREAITWGALEEVPPPPTIPPQTSVGPLDCGEEVVLTQDVPSEDTTAGDVAMAAHADVVEVEEDGNGFRATGYDSNHEVVVVVAFQDIHPFPYRIYTCP